MDQSEQQRKLLGRRMIVDLFHAQLEIITHSFPLQILYFCMKYSWIMINLMVQAWIFLKQTSDSKFFDENTLITSCRKIVYFRLVYNSIIELAIYLQTSRTFLNFRFMKLKVKRNFIGSKLSYKAQTTVLNIYHDV